MTRAQVTSPIHPGRTWRMHALVAGAWLGLVAAIFVGHRCAVAAETEARKCADIGRVIAEAHKEKNLLRTRTIERLPMLRLQTVMPNRPPIMPEYDAGLLVEWKDGTGILLKGFGLTLCREQMLTERELVQHRILFASFTKKSKATKPRRRMPMRQAASVPAPSYARGLE